MSKKADRTVTAIVLGVAILAALVFLYFSIEWTLLSAWRRTFITHTMCDCFSASCQHPTSCESTQAAEYAQMTAIATQMTPPAWWPFGH